MRGGEGGEGRGGEGGEVGEVRWSEMICGGSRCLVCKRREKKERGMCK